MGEIVQRLNFLERQMADICGGPESGRVIERLNYLDERMTGMGNEFLLLLDRRKAQLDDTLREATVAHTAMQETIAQCERRIERKADSERAETTRILTELKGAIDMVESKAVLSLDRLLTLRDETVDRVEELERIVHDMQRPPAPSTTAAAVPVQLPPTERERRSLQGRARSASTERQVEAVVRDAQDWAYRARSVERGSR